MVRWLFQQRVTQYPPSNMFESKEDLKEKKYEADKLFALSLVGAGFISLIRHVMFGRYFFL